MEQNKQSIVPLVEECIRNNWERPALSNFRGVTYLYKDVARKIGKLHILYERIGLKPGDKIAVCGRNSAQWCVAMLSVVTYGCVAVPILPDFKPDSLHHLVNHSDARLFMADNSIWENLDPVMMPGLIGALRLADFSMLLSRSEDLSYTRAHLNELFGRRYPERFTPDDVTYCRPDSTDLMLINYTSGSTGFSKGVMLSHRVLWSNVVFATDTLPRLDAGDPVVSVLPLAHMYGLTTEFFFPICRGCHITFLTRTPAPRIIMEAMGEIKPRLVTTVPLVLEKMIRATVLPLMERPLMRMLLRLPIIDSRLLARVRGVLIDAFGGNLEEIMIGGAALNREVEEFLADIHFPYSNGYGMTECGPFIAYAPTAQARVGSCGFAAHRMELKIDSPDPANIPGVLWVRGDNVMDGYYKNPEATAQVIRDGWMSTGDVCTLSDEGYLYIRGRDKNMILGPNGQNIYPEEIESKLNNLPCVAESLIIEDNKQLVALVYPDMGVARQQGLDEAGILELMRENIKTLNSELPNYSRISDVRIYQEEFEKTAKRSIKRYLYMR